MLFNSLHFLIFFPVVLCLYFISPGRLKTIVLLLASVYFYSVFNPYYTLILFLLIVIDYWAALVMIRVPQPQRKLLLILSLTSNLFILGIFKYYDFFAGYTNYAGTYLGWSFNIPYLALLLPIGLSFHTFQSMAYTIEVYKNRIPAERRLDVYALYVLFFPQLVAGPIERPQNLLPQFYFSKYFSWDRLYSGLRLMLWGFFKKIVIADKLAILANEAYGSPTQFNGSALAVATIAFAYQIYCDFSGYSDIAIGTARIMGFDFMKNFNDPYASRSVGEFWRRWHISLSSWFRDYVYLPLGGNRASEFRVFTNLMITFLLSGLWHGAHMTFVVWGGLNGLFVGLERGIGAFKTRYFSEAHWQLPSFISVLVTFILINITWIFFRANSLKSGYYMLNKILSFETFSVFNLKNVGAAFSFTRFDWYFAIGAVLFLELVQYSIRNLGFKQKFMAMPTAVRWSCYYALIISIFLFGTSSLEQRFIYFQF